jgi:hypothetical protein
MTASSCVLPLAAGLLAGPGKAPRSTRNALDATQEASAKEPALSTMTIRDILESVLPDGPNGDRTDWQRVSAWPPDLFAAVATITERSGLYSEPVFMSYWAPGFSPTGEWIGEVRKIGREWARESEPPQAVQDLWKELLAKHWDARVVDQSAAALGWKNIVFRLLSIADEASAGIGFLSAAPGERRPAGVAAASGEEPEGWSPIPYLVYTDHLAWEKKRKAAEDRRRRRATKGASKPTMGGKILPYLPHSLCLRVPPDVVCVQPKTNTPAVGCTLRSLTHNLALLPSLGIVSTHWHIADARGEDLGAFNILIVPYPYSIPGSSFKCVEGCFPSAANDRAFTLEPDAWRRATAPQLAGFLCGLLKAAAPELEPVHAIVLPETALTLEIANDVAKILARKTNLNLFLTGVVANDDPAGGAGFARKGANAPTLRNARNVAAMYRFDEHKVKHTRSSIRRSNRSIIAGVSTATRFDAISSGTCWIRTSSGGSRSMSAFATAM